MLEVGKLVGTRLVQMSNVVLTDSVPGKVYHLTIETKGIANEEEVASVLTRELYDRFKAKVVWMRIKDGNIEVQLIGSPFIWAALIGFIPEILLLLGVVFVLVSVWNVIASIPSWTWALLAVGVGIIFLGPTIAKSLTRGHEKYEVWKYPPPPQFPAPRS